MCYEGGILEPDFLTACEKLTYEIKCCFYMSYHACGHATWDSTFIRILNDYNAKFFVKTDGPYWPNPWTGFHLNGRKLKFPAKRSVILALNDITHFYNSMANLLGLFKEGHI